MVSVRVISLMVLCVYCAVISGEVPVDGDHGGEHGGDHGGHGEDHCVCTRNEFFIHESFNRTCKQGLLMGVKHRLEHIGGHVTHLANVTSSIDRHLAELKTAHASGVNELKHQLGDGFSGVTRQITETKQLFRSEIAASVETTQKSIYDVKKVIDSDFSPVLSFFC